jgi:hypothetical protein
MQSYQLPFMLEESVQEEAYDALRVIEDLEVDDF